MKARGYHFFVACLGCQNGIGGKLVDIAQRRAALASQISDNLIKKNCLVTVIALGHHRNENSDEEPHGIYLATHIQNQIPEVPVIPIVEPKNTAEELSLINSISLDSCMQRKPVVLIATSPSHTRRVALLAECLIESTYRVYGYEIPHDVKVNPDLYIKENEACQEILDRKFVTDPFTNEKIPLRRSPCHDVVQHTFYDEEPNRWLPIGIAL